MYSKIKKCVIIKTMKRVNDMQKISIKDEYNASYLELYKNSGMFSTVEETLRRLSAIIGHSFDGIYITDGQANTIMINSAYEQITGLNKDEVVGRNMKELVQEGIISASGSVRAIEEKRVITLSQKFKTGKRAMITSTPIYDEDGSIGMVVTNVRDLTELYLLRDQVSFAFFAYCMVW